ncbi:MAG TPA: guanylate kinase [Vitreimonas sp.]|uniref:guanylate kinase n=1 Tax=Vitreimonas sp. TaxID=3069702 RepID=UPI002D412DEF|nr:guanylate kinase [Vitreimonas sp.]HYD89500.1 guanylate kinase [Vitreimonas sp.]
MLNENVARRGLMFVLSSPSGAGKSTLAKKLLEADDNMSLSVSATTRPPRPSEVDGREYKFMQREQFEEMADRGEFLEHAMVFGNHYGTPRAPVEAMLIQGRDVLFDVDWQGARALRAAEPQDVVGIFILPPSMAELERRLRARNEDSEDVIARRMARSLDEISHWEEYDYVLVNTLLEQTLGQIKQILAAERLKRQRQMWLALHVERLKRGV